MDRRELTEQEKIEASRLRDAWRAYKAEHPKATQAWLAEESGIGTQGAVGQYLRGAIPLNLPALAAICRVLAVRPDSISPRLCSVVEQYADWVGALHRARSADAGPASDSHAHSAKPIQQEVLQAFSSHWLAEHELDKYDLALLVAPDDSMSKRIRRGDTLLINKANRRIEDGVVVVVAAGKQLRIKRVFLRLDGDITLHSDNPEFPDEIAPAGSLSITGRVVALVGSTL